MPAAAEGGTPLNRTRTALLLVCLPLVACYAAAKPVPVKRGVSDAARAKLLRQAAQTEAVEAREAQALAKRVADSLNTSFRRQQQLATAAAGQHKGYAAYGRDLPALQSDLQAKRTAAKSNQAQEAFASTAIDALAKLHESHRAMFADLVRAARIDDQAALRAIVDAFGLHGKAEAKGQGDGTFTILLDEPDDAPPAPQTAFTFAPTYAEKATSSHTEGLAYDAITTVDLEAGRAFASVAPGAAGYQTSRSAVAEFVTCLLYTSRCV